MVAIGLTATLLGAHTSSVAFANDAPQPDQVVLNHLGLEQMK
jgi:hypothetical protein